MRRSLAFLALLAACTDPEPEPTPPEPGDQVTFDSRGALFVAVQPDGGDWEVLTPGEDGLYSFDKPEVPYALVSVCVGNGAHEVTAILAGPDDGVSWDDVCSFGDEYQPFDVITGYAASVFLGRSTWNVPNTGGNTAPVGVYDIGMLIWTATPYVSLIRDVEVDGPTTISPPIGGFSEMIQSELQITGELGTNPYSSPNLEVGHDTWLQVRALPMPSATSAWIAPPELLLEGDTQTHTFVSAYLGAAQWVEVDRGPGRSADPVAVTLAGEMATAILKNDGPTPRIQAESAGDWEVLRAEIWGAYDRWYLSAYPGWTAAHPYDGVVAFPDATALAGWDADWKVSDPEYWGVRVGEIVDDGVIRGAQFYENTGF